LIDNGKGKIGFTTMPEWVDSKFKLSHYF
jgi:hypothetical protein